MPTGRRRRDKPPDKGGDRPKLRIKISPLFKEDLSNAEPEILKVVKAILRQVSESELLNPGKRFKVLRVYKKYKIWYLRAGGDCRITAVFGEDGCVWLLSIETHDSLDRAPRRVIAQIRRLVSESNTGNSRS